MVSRGYIYFDFNFDLCVSADRACGAAYHDKIYICSIVDVSGQNVRDADIAEKRRDKGLVPLDSRQGYGFENGMETERNREREKNIGVKKMREGPSRFDGR